MNILYISKLAGHKWQGPNQSVPNQIGAQSRYDNVFWYNLNYVLKNEWLEKSNCYNLNDYPELKISKLPPPFNKPDLVIFEGVYEYPFCKLIFEIWKRKLPYIIIPRSALTVQARNKKKLKKIIGNSLFFNKFIRKAKAIQYLTQDEYINSGSSWNKKAFIIPNGVDTKKNVKQVNKSEKLIGVFIGRIDTYQKGLDLLIDACSKLRVELLRSNCVINLYGPDRYNSKDGLNSKLKENNLEELISIHDAVFDGEKEKILLEADFFIMTSRFEGHPMGLIEALSYGLPCLVTDGTNMAKEIKESDAGWIAEISVESITLEFKKLLNNIDTLQDKGKNAITLSRLYDWDTIAELSSQKYLELIK
ncbi:glycosyltransferase [Evansella sp. AB-P1]|uniref:glycosyltransferase n=1 Tax=Evansella sp. AB-P1 TaxID=3037653 RepID=UPI00241EAD3D|nr:glycosyltransferase [Evansella sp. AB-P1]MDG5789303.1 glycosyltransferase [Evansella sp. AB-P1]